MDFEPLKLEHIQQLAPYFEKNNCRICDCTIGGTFIWRDFFKTQYALEDDVLFLKVKYFGGLTGFTPPRGDISDDTFRRIDSYCKSEGLKTIFCAVSESWKDELCRIFDNVTVTTDRNWTDYLYKSEDMRTLAGRRFSGQRNHINKFCREYTNWSFEDITPENAGEVREYFAKDMNERQKDSPTYVEGNLKNLEVMDNFELYGLYGGILRVDGEIIGASFGETVGDTMFIHTEKCDISYAGSYPVMVRSFAQRFVTDGVKYINREEDDGDEGLRTSKLSYHPELLLDKYVVEIL